jgi:hypothetical protein
MQTSAKASAHAETAHGATPRPAAVRNGDSEAHRTEVALHVTLTSSSSDAIVTKLDADPDDAWNCNTRANGARSNGAAPNVADGTTHAPSEERCTPADEATSNGDHARGAADSSPVHCIQAETAHASGRVTNGAHANGHTLVHADANSGYANVAPLQDADAGRNLHPNDAHAKGSGSNGTLPSATAPSLAGEAGEIEAPRERAPASSHVALTGLRALDGGNLEADLTYAVEQPLPTAPAADRVVPLFPRRESPFRKPYASGFAVGGGPVDWRGFASDLALARGPKPLTFVERLFMTRYVPLMEAIARGEADDAARRTAEQWAEDFARSYTEGFSALRVTGKRPRMVLDAPQLASQVARLHGAKSTHLILVDAMRFDLGVRVHDRM